MLERGLFLGLVVAAVGAGPRAGLAQAEDPTTARSRVLFEAGQEALAQRREAEACRHFRESLQLLRSPGTLLYVGSCDQADGDPLTALEAYEDSVRAALDHPKASDAQRQAWIQEARRRIATQTTRIGEVVVVAVETPGLELTLDGKRVDVRWTSVRVNPGQHELVASASGYREHRETLSVAAGARRQVVVPRLEPAAVAPPPTPVEAPVDAAPIATESSTPMLPWGLIGVGTVSVAAGIVTGIVTMRLERELAENCPDGDCPDASWQGKIDGANQTALITNILWGVGLGSAAVGVTLLVLDSSRDDGSAEAHLGCRGGYCGARLTGTF